MATTADLLTDGFGRVHETVHAVLDGLSDDDLVARVGDGANTIGWLVWHLYRVQDDHVAGVAGTPQLWHADGWRERFGLDRPDTVGYGDSAADVAAVRVPADLLRGYADAVHAATCGYVATLADDDLDRVVDEHWDPPVTAAVRLVSVLDDDLQHAGQAAYVRGLLDRP